MNSRLSPAERRKYEAEYSEFLTKRIGHAGGSIQLQHLSGHLSQLRPEIRNTFGTSKTDLVQFLKDHDNLFFIEKNIVSLVGSSLSHSGYDSDGSSVKSSSVLPSKIENGKGVVVKLFREYGFIKSKEPIKTDVFFQSSCFGSKDIDLTSFLYIGAVVFFHAKRESSADNRRKYRAVKVWKQDDGFGDNPVVPKSRKSRETGLYDALTCESDGIIQRVFPNLGFIAIKGDHNNTVFFYKNRVKGYDNVVDLTKILETGDRVEFFALRSTKPDAKARWEATKVWKIGGKEKQNAVVVDKSSNINFPVAAVQPITKEMIKNQSNINFPVAAVQPTTKEMIKNETGKICPRSNGAVIKFGRDQLADGDAALYYMSGEQVTDIGWVFSEEEEVKFDAVKIKSAPGWKAVLVWVGDKPDVVLPTCIGDFSEFTDEEEETEFSSPVTMSKSSSYVSLSSLSSKSASVRSECNSSKKNNSKVKHISKSRESINDEKVTDYRKTKSKVSKTFHEDSSSSSTTSKNSQKLKKDDKHKSSKQLNSLGSNKISNWADAPYPGEENFDNNLTSKTSKSVKVDNIVYGNNVEEVAEEETWQPSDSEDSSDCEADNVISNSELPKDSNDLTENNSEVKSSIKRFYDIKGEVYKVYSKYAEVKSRNLEKYVSFFWSDFYTDGMSVEELELDDLKQVLKVGDSVKFNCFVIVDDSGQSWHKVPLAWVGSKPKRCIEISPEEFIKQHNIEVTLSNETDSHEVLENKANRRKFLTAYEDVIPDNHSDKFSNTESCYEEESLPYKQPPKEPLERPPSTKEPLERPPSTKEPLERPPSTKKPLEMPKEPLERPLSLDFKNVSSTVRQMLKKIFSPDSEIDLKSVSEEIVHIISNTYNEKKSDVLCSACKGDSLNQLCKSVNMKNSEVQTIITGDIIATNIFTEC